ncbi:hypothetical protein Amn_20550 [Aminobacter sp. Y103A]|uniref:hypothetical protein n=1 Tax=Aminobacter sp. Y103A TaxID=1870862 RepID=UPI002573B79F|nr:hypothetical protein [Aminobacter sp. SS-2016]BBD37175.1 hypothetical protein Amn_20550 [Aminobacter sp. SS-2016]
MVAAANAAQLPDTAWQWLLASSFRPNCGREAVNSSSNVSALDFETVLGALRRIIPLPTDQSDLHAPARCLIAELCPEKTYPDALIEALVQAAASEPHPIRRYDTG